MTTAGVVAFLLLLAHALSTHGPWFALIWLGLTSAIGAAAATGASDVPSALRFGAVLYLAGLLAKGFVERTPHRGSIPLFVAAHALFSGWLALPIELSRSAEFAAAAAAIVPWGAAGGIFGLAYRLVSKRTEDDRAKLLWLAPAAVGAAALARALA